MTEITDEQHRQKMQRRQEIQAQRVADRQLEKGLIIVQFIKGAWNPAEKAAFDRWGDQISFLALGEGFTWETQDRNRDIAKAQEAWEIAITFIHNPEIKLVLLDEINIALKLGYLQVESILTELAQKPDDSHIILTGRGAPSELIAVADLVTEMKLIKHPFRSQGVKAQPGIEF